MKICVSSTGTTLEAAVDPRFGRCAHFLFVDSDTLEFEAVPNPSANLSGGAGVRSAQVVVDRGAGVLVTGRVGPNAGRVLRSAGIEIHRVAGGTVRQAVEGFMRGGAVSEPVPPLPWPSEAWGIDPKQRRRMGRGRGLGSRRRT